MKYQRLSWPKDHSVNDATLDSHHEQFVEVANRIIDMANDKNTDVDALMVLLTQLGDQVLYHFETEETYLKKLHYPEIEQHLKSHDAQRVGLRHFIAKVREDQKTCKTAADCQPLVEEVAAFVTEWVGKHMMGNAGTEAFFIKMRNENG